MREVMATDQEILDEVRLKGNGHAFEKRTVMPRGGLWEEPEWTLIEDYVMGSYQNPGDCPHARFLGKVMHQLSIHSPATTRVEEIAVYVIPRVIEALNEGQNNSTGVCLDCVKELTPDHCGAVPTLIPLGMGPKGDGPVACELPKGHATQGHSCRGFCWQEMTYKTDVAKTSGP